MTKMSRRTWTRLAMTSAAAALAPVSSATTRVPQSAGREYRYVHLDVFTDRPFAGNQLAVFTDPAGLDAAAMQAFTAETNFSECTFIFPPEGAGGADFRVRIFTRSGETPFAGHPTIGSAFALAYAGILKPGTQRTIFGLGIGPTPIDLDWTGGRLAFARMTQLRPTFGHAV